jgi:hypothetical protein
MLNDEDAERRLHQMRQTAAEYARAAANRTHLDEFKKSKLAMLMKQAEAQGHKTTAAQEREARADAQYIALLENLKTATEESERLRWEMELGRMGVSLYQTQAANMRIERKTYGG